MLLEDAVLLLYPPDARDWSSMHQQQQSFSLQSPAHTVRNTGSDTHRLPSVLRVVLALEYTSIACTNMHSPEAALDTFVTTSIAMLGFSTYGFIFFRIAGEILSCTQVERNIGEGKRGAREVAGQVCSRK